MPATKYRFKNRARIKQNTEVKHREYAK